jgi:hypothetical protein
MSFNNQPQAQPIQSLVKQQLDYMVAAVMWIPDLFASAKGRLLPEYFDRPGEAQYAVVLRALYALAEDHSGRLPLEALANTVYLRIMTMAENEIKGSAPGVYSDLMTAGNVFHLTTSAYNNTNLNRSEAFALMQAFLNERRVLRKLGSILAQGCTTQTQAQLHELYHDASRIQAIGSTAVLPATHIRTPTVGIQLQPTGLPYIDYRIGGGVSKGKIYSLIGPTGVGKTLNMVAIMCSSAIQEQVRHVTMTEQFGAASSQLGNYYYFCYEGDRAEIVRRCIAYLAHIPLRRIERFETEEGYSLCGPTEPLPDYEVNLFPDRVGPEGEPLLSEIERYYNANAVLARNVFVIEMIPSPQDPKRGSGYVQEIQNVLLAQQEDGHPVVGYYIDYAKVAARNHCGNKLDNLRHLIGGMPNECIRSLNNYLPRAHGWIANQVNTEANRRAATWVPHHSYASEAGDFGDNCHYALCLGTRSESDNCCLINCSKHRGFQPTPPSVLYIHGALNRMVCMDQLIDLDTSTGQFLHRQNFTRDEKGVMVVPFKKGA